MEDLRTARLLLRAPQPHDAEHLVRLLRAPEVEKWWYGYDSQRIWDEFIVGDGEIHAWVIEHAADAQVAGLIQFTEQTDPQYRNAGIDLFLGPAFQGRGLGEEAIRAMVEYLVDRRGHHRLTVDPAAANESAQHTYAKVGFRRVGVMRDYERGLDGAWHDGVLMELLARDYARR